MNIRTVAANNLCTITNGCLWSLGVHLCINHIFHCNDYAACRIMDTSKNSLIFSHFLEKIMILCTKQVL